MCCNDDFQLVSKDELLMYTTNTNELSASNNQQLTGRTKDLILEMTAALKVKPSDVSCKTWTMNGTKSWWFSSRNEVAIQNVEYSQLIC
jgi:hypothetical protein